MTNFTKSTHIFLLVLALCFVACAPKNTQPTTPVVPTPPQVKLAKDVTVLKNGLLTALTALQAARTAGSLSPESVTFAENKILAPMALAGKAIDSELLTQDDWPVMRAKVLMIVTKTSIAGLSSSLPPNAATTMAVAIETWNAIAASVGGPKL